jgi:hypothetical protein
MHKSWKPSERDESSGLDRLIGDFVYEDGLRKVLIHLLFDPSKHKSRSISRANSGGAYIVTKNCQSATASLAIR